MADLTTINNVKEWLQLKAATADDALLTRMITAVSSAITHWLGRDILQTVYTYTFDGPGGTRWPLAQYPITAVSSVVVDGVAVPQASSPSGSGYFFTESMLFLRGYSFARGFGNCTVNYTAGYAAVPGAIEQACIEWLGYLYRNRERIGHQSKQIASETVTFITGPMPKSVQFILQDWRKVALT